MDDLTKKRIDDSVRQLTRFSSAMEATASKIVGATDAIADELLRLGATPMGLHLTTISMSLFATGASLLREASQDDEAITKMFDVIIEKTDSGMTLEAKGGCTCKAADCTMAIPRLNAALWALQQAYVAVARFVTTAAREPEVDLTDEERTLALRARGHAVARFQLEVTLKAGFAG